MVSTLDLNGAWQFSSERFPEPRDGEVPGCIHTDLLRLNLIPDPNWRTNELDLQWIGKMEWTYARTFEVDADLLGRDHVVLEAEGLDTLATVTINGAEVARTDNMHRTWKWAVKKLLRSGSNEIAIKFAPPGPYLEERAKINPLEAWNEYSGNKHRGWIRKQHSNFGWDFCPVLVSCGIWGPIRLVAWDDSRLVDLRIDQTHRDGAVDLTFAAERSEGRQDYRLKVEVFSQDNLVLEATLDFPATTLSGSIGTIKQPKLWWPAGLGGQPLYRVRARLLAAKDEIADEREMRIGLRTLKLVQKPDAHGTSFHFEANGIPFFAKGSNWPHPLPYPAWPEGDGWRQLLRDAIAAQHHMLRLWGGAYFPPDKFYDLCDELGLAIWQDFLFACGPYPAFDENFLESVAAEARDNVQRIRHHPCLALWCGNNELEGTFFGPETTKAKMSFADYDKIFNGILKSAVENLDPQGNYWPASPVCMNQERSEVKPDAGDIHIWEIWFGDSPFENYRNYPHRFVSEFGFQSMPTPKAIESFTLPEDRQFNSPVLEHHQRSQPGNTQHLKQLLNFFRLPADFADQVILTQLVQALGVKTGVEHWRRNMPRTMGTLYWQLNDCWPCPSWSSIDFTGRWKALHYFSARFFAPVLISGLEDREKRTIEIHLTSDQGSDLAGEICWRILDPAGRALVSGTLRATAGARSSALATTLTVPPEISFDACLVELEFVVDGNVHASNLVMFDRPKRFTLSDPKLRLEVSEKKPQSFEIKVEAQAPALWAWLDCDHDLKFSDNFVSVLPGRIWSVMAQAQAPLSPDTLRSSLRLKSLYSTYLR